MPTARPRAGLPREALAFLRRKGLETSRHWLDVWREQHAMAFTVAQMTELDLVDQTHREIQRVLRKGETLETFRGRLEPWLKERGWAPRGRGGDIPTRLKRIYDTNLRVAHAAGQWDRIQRTQKDLPWLVYRLGPSEKHRPDHEAWSGTCLRVGDPWWNAHYPPNGWGCKCYVQQVARPPKGATTKRPGRIRANGRIRLPARSSTCRAASTRDGITTRPRTPRSDRTRDWLAASSGAWRPGR